MSAALKKLRKSLTNYTSPFSKSPTHQDYGPRSSSDMTQTRQRRLQRGRDNPEAQRHDQASQQMEYIDDSLELILNNHLDNHLDKMQSSIISTIKDEMQKPVSWIMGALFGHSNERKTSGSQQADILDRIAQRVVREIDDRETKDVNRYKKENDALHSQVGRLDSELERAQAQIQGLASQLESAKQTNRVNAEKIAKFRDMLTKQPTNIVMDNDVKQKFTFLRSHILAMVKKTYEVHPGSINFKALRNPFQQEVFSPCATEECDSQSITNRIRGVIFYHLCVRILNEFLYGPGNLNNLQLALANSEFLLLQTLPKENLKEYVDWRTASIKCACVIGGNTNLARETASEIWNFLEPVAVIKGAENKGKKLLLGLCEEALELATLLRSSRDVFEVRRVFTGPLEAHMDYADVEAEVGFGGNSEPAKKSGDISYCVFGALLKRTEEDPLEEIVMEKASAVVYKE